MMKTVGFAEIQDGDQVEIEEHYDGAFFHFRGKVTEKTSDSVTIGGPGHWRTVMGAAEGRTALKVWVKQPDPPTVAGSVVKFYHSGFLACRAAYLDAAGIWRDVQGRATVQLNGLEWTVLFDAGKDA